MKFPRYCPRRRLFCLSEIIQPVPGSAIVNIRPAWGYASVESLMTACSIGKEPTWATKSAGAICLFLLEPDVRHLRHCLQQRTKENNDAARAAFEKALAIDPNDALALAAEASTYVADKAFGWAEPNVDYDAMVIGMADRSIAIDPDNARAYAAKGMYLTIENHPADGLRAAEAGLAVNPNDPFLHAVRGMAESFLGDFEQAKSEGEQAMRLSPRDPNLGSWHNLASGAELGLGHFDAAIEESNKSIDAGYRVYFPYVQLTLAYALKGKLDDAKAALAEARRLNPKLTVKSAPALYPTTPGVIEGLRKVGLPEE